MKKIIAIAAFIAAISPISAFAQQADVDPSAIPSCAVISANLRYGARDTTDSSVSTLQDFLNSRGYLSSQPSGFFGQKTFAAVRAFQLANNISASGYVGPVTRAKIRDIDCNGATSTPVAAVPVWNPIANSDLRGIVCPVGLICSPIVQTRYGWHSTDPAASDSVEGLLRAQNNTWSKSSGDITVGSYVQDILEGRLDQPVGRGAIGKVTSVSYDSSTSQRVAMVDFGRGYAVGIRFSELSPLYVISPVVVTPPVVQTQYVWHSTDPAASDSVEGQLRAQGKTWTKSYGTIIAGSYVQDILEGRLDQPRGRGAIGKVTSVSYNANGQLDATVDFGRGYSVGIHASELSLLSVVSPVVQVQSRYYWHSSDAAASDSIEGQLRAQNKTWAKASGDITAGSYVQDILEGRLDQPVGRGAIGKVSYVTYDSSVSQSTAMVDFGRGYAVGIRVSELSLLTVTNPVVQSRYYWHSTDAAASDSVEGQLRAQGKSWTKTPGDIAVGSYVQDTLEGRLDQPIGRGAIGKVTSVSSDGATVDFGRGLVVGIRFSELSLVTVN
ncbi:MAG: peptidase [Candidatus Taylorbacteria bacterium]|nr:peptidase [Candidatus Taylorbacteria bacterium]